MGLGQSSLSGQAQERYDDPAEPTRRVRALLAHLGLPAELVLEIMDLADYYPRVSTTLREAIALRANAYKSSDNCSAFMYLSGPEVPGPREGEQWRVRSVVWTIDGRDQGWGGDHPGTFESSSSWYEACIFRPTDELEEFARRDSDALLAFVRAHCPCRTTEDCVSLLARTQSGWDLVPNPAGGVVWPVQYNRVSSREFERYTVEWLPEPAPDEEFARVHQGCGSGAGFIDVLRPGDVVGLWMRAMYPGWTNTIKEGAVEIVYDVR